ncbi:MAG TPA: gluconate 2-dehydrogenase subunit 3 family protein [Candidatus Acidoferrum sp.]|nr:gluconate 2-dehydrogenase subunit 3 family protein [Candidatus Acidoferrum sp.]
MAKHSGLTRRRFLQVAATAAASSALISCGRHAGPWRFFTSSEARTIEALCEQIIPADQDPGATWAGTIYYVDSQLVGHFRRLQSAYRSGIASFDAACRAAHGQLFADLPFDTQTTFLTQLPASLQPFFDMVITHTMQGFYGDARHAGNRDAVSWRMLGIPVIPIRGRDHYEFPRKG